MSHTVLMLCGLVRVHGGYRRRLGGYTVTLDSDVTLHQGYVDGTDEDFDAVLFNATGLPAGPHQLRITNASNDVKRPVFDIDHVSDNILRKLHAARARVGD